MQEQVKNSAFRKSNALFLLLENWKNGIVAKNWKLKSVLGEEAYDDYVSHLNFLKATVEELYSIDMHGRGEVHKKLADAIALYNLQKGRGINLTKDGYEPIELINEVLLEMTDEEIKYVNEDILEYDVAHGTYTFDEGWWYNNSGYERSIFKTGDTRSLIEKKTEALLWACAYIVKEKKNDNTEVECIDKELKLKLKGLLGKLETEL